MPLAKHERRVIENIQTVIENIQTEAQHEQDDCRGLRRIYGSTAVGFGVMGALTYLAKPDIVPIGFEAVSVASGAFASIEGIREIAYKARAETIGRVIEYFDRQEAEEKATIQKRREAALDKVAADYQAAELQEKQAREK